MNPPQVALAVAALTGKVERLRASAASQPRDAARKLELVGGLEQLAVLVAHGLAEVRGAAGPVRMGRHVSAVKAYVRPAGKAIRIRFLNRAARASRSFTLTPALEVP